jgi:RHS repeat-associated protein
VSDKKIGVDENADGIIDYYNADVISANDYAPGGMMLPGRKYNTQKLINGYNGKRYDNEIYGEGNFMDYGDRMYDPRLVRFPSVDPLKKSYPYFSPYQYAGNNPVKFIDLDGAEPVASKGELESIRLTNSVDKGNLITGYYDPKDKLHLVDVQKVFDPIKKQAFFIHEENGTHYYWNSTESNLRIKSSGGKTESNGQWKKYETYEQTQARLGAESADMIGGFFAGAIGIAAAAPAVIAAAPTIISAGATYGTQAITASTSARIISAGANAGFQYIQNAPEHGWGSDNLGHINISSVGLSFINPFSVGTNAVVGNFGKTSWKDKFSEAIGGNKFNLKNAIIGSVIDYGGGKLSNKLDASLPKYGGFNKTQSEALSNILSNTVTTPANVIANEASKNKNP